MLSTKAPPQRNSIRLVEGRRGLDALLRCIIAFPATIKKFDRISLLRGLWHSRPVREFLARLRRKQIQRLCVADRDTLTAEDWLDLFYKQHSPLEGDLGSYFFCRLAQPRHLATLVLTSYLPPSEKPILDLACGFGHLGYNLAESPAAHSVVGVDRNFFQLWVAQYWDAHQKSVRLRRRGQAAALCGRVFRRNTLLRCISLLPSQGSGPGGNCPLWTRPAGSAHGRGEQFGPAHGRL